MKISKGPIVPKYLKRGTKAQNARSFKLCPGGIYENLRKQFRVSKCCLSCSSCSIRLGNNFLPNWEQKNHFFWKMTNSAKKVKGGTL